MSDNVTINNGSGRADKSTVSTMTALSWVLGASLFTSTLIVGVGSVYLKGEASTDQQLEILKLQIEQDRKKQKEDYENLSAAIKSVSEGVDKLSRAMVDQVRQVRDEASQRIAATKAEAERLSSDRFNATEAKIMFLKIALANPGMVMPNPKFKNRSWFYSGMGRESLEGEWVTKTYKENRDRPRDKELIED